MQLKRLEVFDAIVRSGTVFATARELGMTQSAVSRVLAKFEADMGFELFFRQQGKLVPAPRASAVLSRVRKVIEACSSLREMQMEHGNASSRILNLVAVPSLAYALIPSVLGAYIGQHPDVRIRFDVRTAHATIEAVIAGHADIAIITLPASHPALTVTPLFRVKSCCVMPDDHPLASRERVSAHDLVGEPLILLPLRQPTRQLVDDSFARAGVTPNVRIETANVVSACRCAEEHLGIAIVNSLMAAYYDRPGLTLRPFEPQIHHTLALLEPSGRTRSAEVTDFIRCLQQDVKRVENLLGFEIDYLYEP